jgi:hypothetical protein
MFSRPPQEEPSCNSLALSCWIYKKGYFHGSFAVPNLFLMQLSHTLELVLFTLSSMRMQIICRAAVIPAPIAYIEVAAVKTLVVGSQSRASSPTIGGQPLRPEATQQAIESIISHEGAARPYAKLLLASLNQLTQGIELIDSF